MLQIIEEKKPFLNQLTDKLKEHNEDVSKLYSSHTNNNSKVKELSSQIDKLEKTQKNIKNEFEPIIKELEKLEIEATNILNIIKENNKNMTLEQIAAELEQRI